MVEAIRSSTSAPLGSSAFARVSTAGRSVANQTRPDVTEVTAVDAVGGQESSPLNGDANSPSADSGGGTPSGNPFLFPRGGQATGAPVYQAYVDFLSAQAASPGRQLSETT